MNKKDKLIWTTEKRRVNELKEYDKNPRYITDNQFENLIESLDKFNYVELVAIDRDNMIIAGHMRVRALRSLHRNKEEIEVRVPNRKLTQEEFDEYLIRSNKNTGEWDFEILANAWNIDELVDWGFKIEEFGIKEIEEIAEKEPKEQDKDKTISCPSCGHEFVK